MIKKIFAFIFIFFMWQCSSQHDGDIKQKSEKNKQQNIQAHKSIHQQQWEEETHKNYSVNSLNKIKVTEATNITKDMNRRFINPKFTKDGTKLLFTTENYKGIWVYDITKDVIRQVNSLPGAGYKFEISDDGEKVYFRNKTQKGNNNRSVYTIVEQDIQTKKINILYTSKYALTPPVLLDNNLLFLENDRPKIFSLKEKKIIENISLPFFYVVNNKLMKYQNGKNERINLNNMKAVSVKYTADKKNLICLTATKGLILLDENGIPVNTYPKAFALSKLPNSNLVVFTEEKDNGKQITESKMYLGFTDSNKKTQINELKDKKVFNPVWNVKDNVIAYNTEEGKIKTIKLNIKTEEEK